MSELNGNRLYKIKSSSLDHQKMSSMMGLKDVHQVETKVDYESIEEIKRNLAKKRSKHIALGSIAAAGSFVGGVIATQQLASADQALALQDQVNLSTESDNALPDTSDGVTNHVQTQKSADYVQGQADHEASDVVTQASPKTNGLKTVAASMGLSGVLLLLYQPLKALLKK